MAMDLNPDRNDTLSRLIAVDVLRIVSVAIVIASHYGILPDIGIGGTHGVVIFFMVSGFCMAFSMQGRTGSSYLAARFWRLAPLLVICATVTAIGEHLFPYLRPDRVQTWTDYLRNITCLPFGNMLCDVKNLVKHGEPRNYLWVDGAYWSLLVELRFYILLWFLAYAIRLRNAGLAVAMLGFVAGLNLELSLISKGNDFLQYLSFFAFGMGAREIKDGKTVGYLTCLLASGSFVSNCLIGTTAPSMGLNLNNMASYIGCFVIFSAAIFLMPNARSTIVGRLGLLTYPVYLLHQDLGLMALEFLKPSLGDQLATALTTAAVIIAAAAVLALDKALSPRLRRSTSATAQMLLRTMAKKTGAALRKTPAE
jgi:peptidoglycan/LPS O-acetylase OafA/YrhL